MLAEIRDLNRNQSLLKIIAQMSRIQLKTIMSRPGKSHEKMNERQSTDARAEMNHTQGHLTRTLQQPFTKMSQPSTQFL